MQMNNPNKIKRLSFSFWMILASVVAMIAITWQLVPKQPITDPSTTLEIPFVEKSKMDESMKLIQYGSKHNVDSMHRDDQDYYKYPVVVDTDYYQTHEAKRGDVVYFNDKVGIGRPEGKPSIKWGEIIGRIVGLPGEKVEILAGHVYVDDRKLDTFYAISSHSPETFNKGKIRVPSGHYYIMFDNWFRAGIPVGPTPQSDVIGKVLGYVEQ